MQIKQGDGAPKPPAVLAALPSRVQPPSPADFQVSISTPELKTILC